MLELLNKMELLKQELDKLEIFKKLEEVKKEIYENQQLVNKIKNYNRTFQTDLRLEIYDYDEVKKYKRLENEVNFMILEINHKFSVMKDSTGCSNENH